MKPLLLISGIIVVATIVAIVKRFTRPRRPPGTKPLPGPRGLPFIGSVHELPAKCSWLKFHEWGEKYGPIYQVNLAGTNHVWISRDHIARDLLAKRSVIYSDRPHIPALQFDNRTSGQYLPLMSRNELWTRQRKFAKQIMDTSAKQAWYGYPELESIRMLFELLSDPKRYHIAIESYIARVTSRLAWGTATPSDELKQRARELLICVSPNGALGNKFPWVMALPTWLSPAKAWERRRGRTERKFFEMMQQEVREAVEDHKPKDEIDLGNDRRRDSWMGMFLRMKDRWEFGSDIEGAYAVGMHGIAGALTIAAPMQSFCLALTHYPQYQRILHNEIDAVLGDRPPRLSDLPDMPVLRAFIRETLRWRPPVPTGIPHELSEDDVYEGYHIHAGSVMHPLEWSISRDPDMFPEPDSWNPMRWLDARYPTYCEPLSKYPTITGYSQFGYGRRVCQGMAVTEADLFAGIGSIAWLFSIEPYVSAQGWRPRQSSTASSNTEDSSEKVNPKGTFTLHANDSGVYLGPVRDGVLDNASLKDNGIGFERLENKAPDQENAVLEAGPGTPKAKAGECTTARLEDRQAAQAEPDPTMAFSSLLIAKPLLFDLQLKIRNVARAKLVCDRWVELRAQGEFEEPQVFWQGGNQGDAQHGWGAV